MIILLAIWTAGFGLLNHRVSGTWKGSWKIVGWLPTAGLAVWDLFVLISTGRDGTSHNLWPMEGIGMSLLLFLLLMLIGLAHEITIRWRAR